MGWRKMNGYVGVGRRKEGDSQKRREGRKYEERRKKMDIRYEEKELW